MFRNLSSRHIKVEVKDEKKSVITNPDRITRSDILLIVKDYEKNKTSGCLHFYSSTIKKLKEQCEKLNDENLSDRQLLSIMKVLAIISSFTSGHTTTRKAAETILTRFAAPIKFAREFPLLLNENTLAAVFQRPNIVEGLENSMKSFAKMTSPDTWYWKDSFKPNQYGESKGSKVFKFLIRNIPDAIKMITELYAEIGDTINDRFSWYLNDSITNEIYWQAFIDKNQVPHIKTILSALHLLNRVEWNLYRACYSEGSGTEDNPYRLVSVATNQQYQSNLFRDNVEIIQNSGEYAQWHASALCHLHQKILGLELQKAYELFIHSLYKNNIPAAMLLTSALSEFNVEEVKKYLIPLSKLSEFFQPYLESIIGGMRTLQQAGLLKDQRYTDILMANPFNVEPLSKIMAFLQKSFLLDRVANELFISASQINDQTLLELNQLLQQKGLTENVVKKLLMSHLSQSPAAEVQTSKVSFRL